MPGCNFDSEKQPQKIEVRITRLGRSRQIAHASFGSVIVHFWPSLYRCSRTASRDPLGAAAALRSMGNAMGGPLKAAEPDI